MSSHDSGDIHPSLIVEEQVKDWAEKETTTATAKPSHLRPPLNPLWTRATDYFVHHLIPESVNSVALLATYRPRTTICSIALFSLALAVTGFYTNFELDVDEFNAYAPYGIRTRRHNDWILEESGFPPDDRLYVHLLHANGANVIGVEGIRKSFEAYQVVYDLKEYKEFCTLSNQQFYHNKDSDECRVSSPLRFWNYNRSFFEETVRSDEDVMATLLQERYPDGTPVQTRAILGTYRIETKEDGTEILTAESLLTVFQLPDLGTVTNEFEIVGMDAIFPMRDAWANSQQPFRLEILTNIAYANEFTRAIEEDYKLIPVVFLIMSAFTCGIFYRKDPVESRILLGIGAVITIMFSVTAGYGFMWICGVPLNNLSTLVPFVVFGVGLDDTFIITGAFARTKRSDSMEVRIRQTMKDVGVSISVTTLSTCMALALGALSMIPAVRWLCLYALTTILIDFIWQISFFVALLVLDEERLQANRRGCCVCFEVNNAEVDTTEDQSQVEGTYGIKPSFVDQMMVWYAHRILHPVAKSVVLISFAALFGVCAYSASKLTQEFRITELLPENSYVIDFLEASDAYTPKYVPVMAYFRYVDQSDNEIQEQMIQYIDELSNMTQFADVQYCWINDVQLFLKDESAITSAIGLSLQNMTFNEQLQLLLADPTVEEVYGNNIVLDQDGNIEASRCMLFVEEIDWNDVQDQINLMREQKRVTAAQPINQGRSEWAFFSHDVLYLTFEFYDVIEREFVFTAVVGVIAVTGIGFLCIPHWTATLFVLPMMGVLYVDLIGIIQAAGLHINIVTHVTLAMAVGLLVDYLVHVLLRFYECSDFPTREEKVRETLSTLGAAVLSGGLSTLLGVLPLVVASSQVTRTVFVAFLAMVTLGVGHGLIFLPVLLSIIGPESTPLLGQGSKHSIHVKAAEKEKDEVEPEEIAKEENEVQKQLIITVTGDGEAILER